MASSNPIWSKNLISSAKKVLKHHTNVEEALPDIEKALGFEVSRDALDKAFKRYGESTPFTFLKVVKSPVIKILPTPKEELVRKVEAKKINKLRKIQGLTDIVLEKVEQALSKIEADTLEVVIAEEVEYGKEPLPPEILWFEISDSQLGTDVDPIKTGNLNTHNWTIFIQKLNKWETEVIDIINERRSIRPIQEVILALGGDIVEGHGIFQGQAYELDQDIYCQIMFGSRDFAQSFSRIIATFPEISFSLLGVAGNHGSLRDKNSGGAPFRANWDLVLYQLMKLRIEKLNFPNVTFNFPETWFIVVKTWGWNHLLVHGDDCPSTGGIPLAGLQKVVNKYQNLLQMPINFAHIGHWHSPASLSTSLGCLEVNGSWIGINSFTKVILEGTPAVQMVHGYTEADGKVWSRKIYLQSRKDTIPKLDIQKFGKK